ncbi:MAG: hypothetical protein BHV62_05895 [Eggerthella sp. 51_9]|nr:MAG: hypothetical protein BHV62_05895 [Eggerthella sp. 51_9]
MELMEAIKGRRSVRKFKPDPIPKEDLEEIIQAGLCAPSAQNLQPWYFVALTKKEDLSYLFSELGTTAFSHRKELEARFKNNPEVVEETMEFMSAMGGSQTIILLTSFFQAALRVLLPPWKTCALPHTTRALRHAGSKQWCAQATHWAATLQPVMAS